MPTAAKDSPSSSSTATAAAASSPARKRWRASVVKVGAANSFKRDSRRPSLAALPSESKRQRELELIHNSHVAIDRVRNGFTAPRSLEHEGFKPFMFAKTFVYEALPPGLNILACFLFEGLRNWAGFHCAAHRNFLLHPRYMVKFFFFFNLFVGSLAPCSGNSGDLGADD